MNPGTATISGGLFVPRSAFKPWLSGALVADIGALGAPDTGNIVSGGLKDCQHNMSGVTLDDRHIYLARWPNVWPNGTWRFDSVVAGGETGTFTVGSTRAASWANETYPAIHGYWVFDWSDSYANISKVTDLGSEVNLTISPPTTVKTHARYIGLNMLSELDDDINGEFFFDPDKQLLYLMPPSDAAWTDGGVFVSFTPSVVSLTGVRNVNLTGLAIKHSKGAGLTVLEPENVWVNDATIAHHGANGTYMAGGSDSGVIGGSVANCGCMGLSVTGGDLVTLSPGNMLVQGTSVSNMSMWKRTYMAGLFWGGVSNRYLDLHISHGPHNGVLGGGNEAAGVDCLFDNLTIAHVASEVSDSGAFYTCGQSSTGWVNPGVIIRNSRFQHIRNVVPCKLGYPSVQAIYLDDMMSFHVIDNVTVEDAQKGFFIGGGRNTTVRNCTCKDVDTCVHIDDRGLNWENDRCSTQEGDLWVGLQQVGYEHPPWSTRFPYLQSFHDGRACVPENNTVVGNYWCGGTFTDVSPQEQDAWGAVFDSNWGTNGSCPSA